MDDKIPFYALDLRNISRLVETKTKTRPQCLMVNTRSLMANAHECFHSRDTKYWPKSHMILLKHELPFLLQAVWTGITRQISMTSSKLGIRSRIWKVQSFHALDSHRTAVKTSEILRSTLTLYGSNIHVDVIIIKASLNNENRNFASVRIVTCLRKTFLSLKMPIHDYLWTQ